LQPLLKQDVERYVGRSGREFGMLFPAQSLKEAAYSRGLEINSEGLCLGRFLWRLAACRLGRGKPGPYRHFILGGQKVPVRVRR
jgi:hypothetical protein